MDATMAQKKIKLALVGRPNVGKSALFNRICGKRIAIVDDLAGVTRDRLYAEAECFGHSFQVVDTGGIDARSQVTFNEEVRRQAEIAIEEADTLVLVVDAHAGATELDLELARILRRKGKPLCVAVNKVDDTRHEPLASAFYGLGIPQIVPVSAVQGWQIAELLEAALATIPRDDSDEEEDPSLKIAIVGRPNVGKSTFVNQLLSEERCIVSPIAGTTRDSIDIPLLWRDHPITLIDTAGIRRKKAEHIAVDKFAALRTQRAIERADVCLLMLDAQEGLTSQEKRIAVAIEEAGKGCVLIFNKWDLVKGFRMEHCLQAVHQQVPFLKHCPTLFISALEGRNSEVAIENALSVAAAAGTKIPTPQLNKFIENALQRNHPTMLNGKRLRIYYMVQIGVYPPKFVLFVNHPSLMQDSYLKYLYNQFREAFPFAGVPLAFMLRGKKESRRDPKRPRAALPISD
jgi:GTP-binding protein